MSSGFDQDAEVFATALATVFDDYPLTGGEFQFIEVDDIALIVQPFEETDTGRVHLMTLSRGIAPPDEVQRLPYGIVFPDGEIHCTGRTGNYGEVRATLPIGEFRIRFVRDNDPKYELDREILRRVSEAEEPENDHHTLLAAAITSIGEFNEDGDASGEPLRLLPRPLKSVWKCGLTVGYDVHFRINETRPPVSLGSCERRDTDAGAVVALKYPADEVRYAVALGYVFDTAQDSRLVAVKVLALPKFGTYRRLDVPLAEFGQLPERGRLSFELLPADDTNLSLFKASVDAIQECLDKLPKGSLRDEVDVFLARLRQEESRP